MALCLHRFALDAVRTTDPSQFHRHMKVIAQAGTGPITEPMQVLALALRLSVALRPLAGFDDAAVQLAVMAQLKTLLKLASRGDANVRRLHRPAAAAAAVVALAESSSAIAIGVRQRGCAAAGSKRSAVVAVPRRREPQAHRADRRRRPRRRACAHFPLRRTSHLRALPPRTLARSQSFSLTMPRTDACGWPAASLPCRRGWARRFRS